MVVVVVFTVVVVVVVVVVDGRPQYDIDALKDWTLKMAKRTRGGKKRGAGMFKGVKIKALSNTEGNSAKFALALGGGASNSVKVDSAPPMAPPMALSMALPKVTGGRRKRKGKKDEEDVQKEEEKHKKKKKKKKKKKSNDLTA